MGTTCDACLVRERERAEAKAGLSDRDQRALTSFAPDLPIVPGKRVPWEYVPGQYIQLDATKMPHPPLSEKYETALLDWMFNGNGERNHVSLHRSDPGHNEDFVSYSSYARMPRAKWQPEPEAQALSPCTVLEVRLLGIDGVELSGGGYFRSYAKMQATGDGRLLNKHAVSFPVWTGAPTMVRWASFYEGARHLCSCEQRLALVAGTTVHFAAGAVSVAIEETKGS
jgi:hypothetical protein